MTTTTPQMAIPLQTSAPHQRDEVGPSTYDLTCNARQIFSRIGYRYWKPSGSGADTLPLGHRGLKYRAILLVSFLYNKFNCPLSFVKFLKN
ncbi:hypothetical protein AVEN_78711-1 [Araneus ventricosus]|uniref:Uncharacterized protein n=1 Tax=Araneus ventricosus TaxID=182803 RepID=A0A4Y2NM22_ARAVE|nr:hypothetical protein AVEN_78711-1 [Araneus ventricosus]